MKQIFVGSTQRSKLYVQIRKTLFSVRCVLVAILVIGIVLPICFAHQIFHGKSGKYSNVVYVSTDYASGSATYVGNNYLLTAAHVLEGMSINGTCAVAFVDPNSEDDIVVADAEIIVVGNYFQTNSPEDDYALLHVSNKQVSDFAEPCKINAGKLAEGANVTVVGYPDGERRVTGGKITSLSSYGRSEIYQTDAKAWSGNSGGALLDANGQLVGIVIQIGVGEHKNDDLTYAVKIGKVLTELSGKGFQL